MLASIVERTTLCTKVDEGMDGRVEVVVLEDGVAVEELAQEISVPPDSAVLWQGDVWLVVLPFYIIVPSL